MQVLNLLGEKYLELTPKGSGKMNGGDTIPVSRTNGSYDIVSTLSELTTTTEAINVPQLSQALTTLGDTVNAASPHIRSTFTGLSRHLPGDRDAATSGIQSCSAGPTGSPSCSRNAAVTSSR